MSFGFPCFFSLQFAAALGVQWGLFFGHYISDKIENKTLILPKLISALERKKRKNTLRQVRENSAIARRERKNILLIEHYSLFFFYRLVCSISNQVHASFDHLIENSKVTGIFICDLFGRFLTNKEKETVFVFSQVHNSRKGRPRSQVIHIRARIEDLAEHRRRQSIGSRFKGIHYIHIFACMYMLLI